MTRRGSVPPPHNLMARLIERIAPGMIRIGKVYYSDLRMNGSRIRRALSTDKSIAQDKLGDLIKQRNAGKHNHAPVDCSYVAAKARFLKLYAAGSKITLRHYLRAFRNFEDAYPVKELTQITPDVMSDLYTKWKTTRGLYVRNRDRECIVAFMRRAEKWNMVPVQDWDLMVKMDEEPRGRIAFFAPAELYRLLKKTYGVWRTMAMLGARAGLRPAEMYSLEWTDIDWHASKMHIDSKLKLGHHIKTYERRTIPIPKDLKDHLWGAFKTRTGDFVIADKDGTRPASLDVLSTYFSRRVRKAGLKGHLYKLRHTYGSHLVQAGVPLQVVRDLMGHRSVMTTEIYAHLIPKMHQAAVDLLPPIKKAERNPVDYKPDYAPS